jgi:hypothetical protein
MAELVRARRTGLVARACRVACLIALGALLAGCDKCGDWFSPWRVQADACRDQAPRPR